MWTKLKKDDKKKVQRTWVDEYTTRGPPFCVMQPVLKFVKYIYIYIYIYIEHKRLHSNVGEWVTFAFAGRQPENDSGFGPLHKRLDVPE